MPGNPPLLPGDPAAPPIRDGRGSEAKFLPNETSDLRSKKTSELLRGPSPTPNLPPGRPSLISLIHPIPFW